MSGFPVPRSDLPSVRVTPEEYTLRKQQADQLLQRTLHQFEEFADINRRHVDNRRWKQDASKERLRLYKERKSSSSSSSSSSSPSENKKAWLLVGETNGRVEDALYAFSCESHVEHALLTQFLYDDISDCTILRMLEQGHEHDPYRSFAYKWFVKPPTSSSKFARDIVYMESSGTTLTNHGKEIGFHLIQSLDIAGFPALSSRNCVRSSRGQSIRTLFRQATDTTVEVFMMAELDAPESRGGLLRSSLSSSSSSSSSSSAGSSVLTSDSLFAIAHTSIKCGETKRLTLLIDECRQMRMSQSRRGSTFAYHEEAVLCSMCRQEKKRFNTITLTDCEVCSTTICNKCRENRRIFVFDTNPQQQQRKPPSMTGKFEQVSCCQTCAFNAQRTRPEAPAWANRRDSSVSSESSSGIILPTTQLQLRSVSVASTVTSGRASSDIMGGAQSSSTFTGNEDDLSGLAASTLQVNELMAQLALDDVDGLGGRISVDSEDALEDIPVMVRQSEDWNANESIVLGGRIDPRRAMVAQHQHQQQQQQQQPHYPSRPPHGMTPQAAHNHQMQLYLRMQQLTQQAEQTYQAASRPQQYGQVMPPHAKGSRGE